MGPALPRLDGLPRDAGTKVKATEQAAWAAVDQRRSDEVSRVFAIGGNTIAVYEGFVPHAPTRPDAYFDAVLRADRSAGSLLRADEVRGLRLFIGKAQCVSCHGGPLFNVQQFHNTGVPERDPVRPERGRGAVTANVRADEPGYAGPFSSANPSTATNCDSCIATTRRSRVRRVPTPRPPST